MATGNPDADPAGWKCNDELLPMVQGVCDKTGIHPRQQAKMQALDAVDRAVDRPTP